ncbi:MAG TPA: hypothetical protein VGC22_03090, partial [Chitinophaga sp.]
MRYYLFLLFLVTGMVRAQAQTALLDKPVTVRADSFSIVQLTDTLEKQTGAYFYYDLPAFDSVYFTATFLHQPMRQVLDSLLGHVGYSASEDGQRHIFLAPGPALTLQIPAPGLPRPAQLAAAPRKVVPPRSARRRLPAASEEENAAVKASYDDFKTYNIGTANNTPGNNGTITGYIRRAATNEGVGNATISVQGMPVKTLSDAYGYYTLTLPKGNYVLHI